MIEARREIFDCEQLSPEWFEARNGVPTASSFSHVMASGRGQAESLTRSKYLRILAGEIISGIPYEGFASAARSRGREMESTLRGYYQLETGNTVEQIGFVKLYERYGAVGASPDGLVGKDGGIEIKSMQPDLLIELMQSGKVPTEHMPQVQGNMLCTGRKWWDLVIGYHGMPLFRRRIYRDSAYIERLRVGLESFYEDLEKLVAWVRQAGKE